MNKIRILSIFGTRPEAIKMCPLVLELRKREQIEPLVCVTGQHREMLDQVLEAFAVRPDFDLDIMKQQQTLTDVTSRAMQGLERVFAGQRPDMVLVHGDTTTAFAAALAAFYAKLPVGHVEAGLRSFDKYSPYPEEMNRKLISSLADIHFAPTEANAENLRREGVEKNVFITGNTAIDALKYTVDKEYSFTEPALRDIDFSRKLVVLTVHRRENYGAPMENIMDAVRRVARAHRDALFVYPVHLSPYVQETARRLLGSEENIRLVPPLGVIDMHNLMARAYMVMTDSGGLQEEAPALGKPVLVLRSETERPEAVAAGTVKVVGVMTADIVQNAELLLAGGEVYRAMARAVNPYGDGEACGRIADDLLYYFGRSGSPAPDFGKTHK